MTRVIHRHLAPYTAATEGGEGEMQMAMMEAGNVGST